LSMRFLRKRRLNREKYEYYENEKGDSLPCNLHQFSESTALCVETVPLKPNHG